MGDLITCSAVDDEGRGLALWQRREMRFSYYKRMGRTDFHFTRL